MNKKVLINVDSTIFQNFKAMCATRNETMKDVLNSLMDSYARNPRAFDVQKVEQVKSPTIYTRKVK